MSRIQGLGLRDKGLSMLIGITNVRTYVIHPGGHVFLPVITCLILFPESYTNF